MLLSPTGRLVLPRAQAIEAELAQATAALVEVNTRTLLNRSLEDLLFDDRKLRLIIGLTEHRKLSTAAAALDRSQSALSTALNLFESQIGCRLFDRTPAGLVPTQATLGLTLSSKRAFAELRHLRADAASAGSDPSGTVVIGTAPLGRSQIVPTAIADIISKSPRIQICTVDNHFDLLLDALGCGDIDIVVGAINEKSELGDIDVEHLFKDRPVVLSSPDHPLAHSGRASLQDLARSKWLAPKSGSPTRHEFDRTFERLSLTPPVPVVETADLGIIKQVLTATDSIAFASASQFQPELDAGTLRAVRVDLPAYCRQISLLTRKGTILTRAASTVVATLRKQIHNTK